MILELDTTLLEKFEELTINHLVFLSLVLNNNQSNNQDVHLFLSRISENEIQELIDLDLISFTTSGDNKIYSPTEKLLASVKGEKTWFDEFYEVFPVYVARPDGTKGYLRANVNKCRKEYNRIVRKSKAMHEHLLQCLHYEIENKMMTGKLGYMKTMWKWLTQHEWEVLEEQMKDENKESFYSDTNQPFSYGTEIR